MLKQYLTNFYCFIFDAFTQCLEQELLILLRTEVFDSQGKIVENFFLGGSSLNLEM